ncbi:MAG: hypothetical protein ACRDNB_06940 [Gaiellaceae bacterium]
MKRHIGSLALLGALLLALTVGLVRDAGAVPADRALVVESAQLAGLPAKAVFPFVDSTPNRIERAHVAVTDGTRECKAGASAPSSVQVLAGQAGGTLAPVLNAATNTGISTRPGQCVFHVTITPGEAGVPATVTDIVVLNSGKRTLGRLTTITVSAEIR